MKKIQVVVNQNQEKIVPFVWFNPSFRPEEVLFEARLIKEGASLHFVGIFFGTNNQSIVFNTHVVHKARKTKSRTTLAGVFFDTSSFANNGMTRILKGAKGADAFFSSKILLFGDAKGRSVPSLEIDENEVRAGHASTVGRPDQEQLFYLRSRGLSEKEAERLIVKGFFAPIIKELSDHERKKIYQQLEARW